jgi:hypothetical protein
MKYLFLFLLFVSIASAQTKQQLMDSIIAFNELHSDCVGFGCVESNQYLNFKKLKKKLNNRQLNKLTDHENGVLRMYAVEEAIQRKCADVPAIFLKELQRNEEITTLSGCIETSYRTSEIVYYNYTTKVFHEDEEFSEEYLKFMANRKLENDEPLSHADSIVLYKNNEDTKQPEADKVLLLLDSIILYNDKAAHLLHAAFTNRVFPKKYLPRIEELAFTKNNLDALQHLQMHFPEYESRLYKYWEEDFFNAPYIERKEIGYYNRAIELLLECKNEKLKHIAFSKLKKDHVRETEYSDLFERTLQKFGYTFEDIKAE